MIIDLQPSEILSSSPPSAKTPVKLRTWVIWKERHNIQTLQAHILDLKVREMAQIEQSMENMNRNIQEQISGKLISAFKGKIENTINKTVQGHYTRRCLL